MRLRGHSAAVQARLMPTLPLLGSGFRCAGWRGGQHQYSDSATDQSRKGSFLRMQASRFHPRLQYRPLDGGSQTFGAGKGSRTGSGRSFWRIVPQGLDARGEGIPGIVDGAARCRRRGSSTCSLRPREHPSRQSSSPAVSGRGSIDSPPTTVENEFFSF